MHVILDVLIYFVIAAIVLRFWDAAKKDFKREIEKDVLDKLEKRR
jgi:hypothetical protein